MTKAELTLKSALISTGLVQPVDSKSKGGSIEVLCRQVPGQEKAWLRVVEELLKACEGSSIHLCRRYILKDGQMVFGWHLSFQEKSIKALSAVMGSVEQVLTLAKPMLGPPAAQVAYAPPTAEQPQRIAPLAPGQHPNRQLPPPRPPGEPGMQQAAPEGFVPRMTTLQNTRDGKGREVVIREMPLPHVFHDMNAPNSKGKGAKRLMGD